MKMKCSVVVFVVAVIGFAVGGEREGKFLNFPGSMLNFNSLISQWNKTAFPEDRRMELEATPHIGDMSTFLDKFTNGFKKCVLSQRKLILESGSLAKRIVSKCFKVELIQKMHWMSESESVSLLNGYLELENIEKPKKTGRLKEPEFENEMFEGKFTEKRRFKRERLENGTSVADFLLRNGRELVEEISYTLEHEEEQERSLKESVMDSDFLSALDEISRKFAVKVNLFPGVAARMRRDAGRSISFDFEFGDLFGFGGSSSKHDDDDDDDDDDEDDESSEKVRDESVEEEENSEEEDAEDDAEYLGKKDGRKKNKREKSEYKKKAKMMKKLAPYLLIPLMIQAIMLPMALKSLLLLAIKALVAGKIALVLVTINLIKNTNFKTDEEEYVERVSNDHYGYTGDQEYGAYIHKRSLDLAEPAFLNQPYRAYATATRRE